MVIDQDVMTPESLHEAILKLFENKEEIKKILEMQDAIYASDKVVKVILDE